MMYRVTLLFLSMFFSSFGWADGALKDATGVLIPSRVPKKVVTLAPSLGELAAEILDEKVDRIVAVSDFTDTPAALSKLPSVGSYSKFNIEKVVSLKPDLVLATVDGNLKDQIKRLRELGLNVVVVQTFTLKQIRESILLIGQALGFPTRSGAIERKLARRLESIRQRNAKRKKGKVLLQIGSNPLVVVGRGSFVHEALEIAGGQNLYGDLTRAYPRPSREDVLARKPEMILVLTLGQKPEVYEKVANRWKNLKQKNVKVINGDRVLRPTLRVVEGIELLEKTLHAQN